MARKTPAKARAEFSEARVKGKLAGSAVAEILKRFAPVRSAGDFVEWRRNPMTMLFIDALREMAVAPPPGYVSQGDLCVDYGLTSGLTLAASLMDDPSLVFPYLFSEATPGPGSTGSNDAGYTAEPDSAPVQ